MPTDRLAQLLRQAGRRATGPRLAILRALEGVPRPLDVGEVSDRLELKVNQATLYRALEALEEDGLVRRVELAHGHAHYELTGDDHHHLVCTKCGRVEDFTGCGAEALVRRALAQNRNFKSVHKHSIELFGICRKCTGGTGRS